MQVSDNWVQGQLAVNTFDRLCIERKWPFVATPTDRDFGKDGYVDVSDGGIPRVSRSSFRSRADAHMRKRAAATGSRWTITLSSGAIRPLPSSAW